MASSDDCDCLVVLLILSPFLLIFIMGIYEASFDPEVPCYFVFGDSFSDNGNSNNLETLAKANYMPYGSDYFDGETGRFTNGETMQDFIVEFLHLRARIPPFVKANNESILKGVNYAAGSAGIRDETGEKLGEQIPLNQQLKNHKTIISRIRSQLGDSSAKKLLSQCIYALQIGTHDYTNNYFHPEIYNTSRQYTPEQYAAVLVGQYSQQIKRLHDDGARKFALFGLEPIGCTPNARNIYETDYWSGCADKLNKAAGLFNDRLELLVKELNGNLTDAKFTYLDMLNLPTLIC